MCPCGHVGMWTCGHVSVWTCVRVDMWACGHVPMCTCRSGASAPALRAPGARARVRGIPEGGRCPPGARRRGARRCILFPAPARGGAPGPGGPGRGPAVSARNSSGLGRILGRRLCLVLRSGAAAPVLLSLGRSSAALLRGLGECRGRLAPPGGWRCSVTCGAVAQPSARFRTSVAKRRARFVDGGLDHAG